MPIFFSHSPINVRLSFWICASSCAGSVITRQNHLKCTLEHTNTRNTGNNLSIKSRQTNPVTGGSNFGEQWEEIMFYGSFHAGMGSMLRRADRAARRLTRYCRPLPRPPSRRACPPNKTQITETHLLAKTLLNFDRSTILTRTLPLRLYSRYHITVAYT